MTSKPTRTPPPRPDAVEAARASAGLSQREVSETVHPTARVWQRWGDGGRRGRPVFWEMFHIKPAPPCD